VKRRPWIRVVVAVVVAVAAVVLAGWAVATRAWDETPGTADVVGVWQRGNSDMRITLYPTGKITFDNVPKGIVDFEGGKHDNTTKLVTVSGKWDPFWNYGWWGGVSSGYSLSGGHDGPLYSDGNGITGYQLSLAGGDDEQFEYHFHRISTKP
jgi:hypothetical protein